MSLSSNKTFIWMNVVCHLGPLLVMIFSTTWTCMQNLQWQVQIINAYICNTTWENLQHVIKSNFAETLKLVAKLLCFSLFFIDFNNP